jgi:hypothetical protein
MTCRKWLLLILLSVFAVPLAGCGAKPEKPETPAQTIAPPEEKPRNNAVDK